MLPLVGHEEPVEVLTGRPTRVYLHGWRIHHGLAGVLLLLVGAALVTHDWRDRWWHVRLEPVDPELLAELRQ